MPDNQDTTTDTSTAQTESVSTSASTVAGDAAETESTQGQSTEPETPPFDNDPWADFGKSEKVEEKKEETESEPEKAKETEKTEEKQEEVKSDEDEVLEEIFKSEKEAKVDLDKQNPEEMLSKQRNKVAEAWASRRDKLAQVVDDYRYEEKPIADVMAKFQELNPKRYEELVQAAAHSRVDENPEATFQRAYIKKMLSVNPQFDVNSKIPTLDEIIAGNGEKQAKPSDNSNPEISAAADKLTEKLGFDWRDRTNDHLLGEDELLMVEKIRTLEAENDATKADAQTKSQEFEELKKQLDEIQKGFAGKAEAELKETMLSIINDYRASVESKLMPHIAKFNGLEINESDTPKIKAFKSSAMQLYTGTEFQRTNGEPSMFESFAYYESSVKEDLNTISDRIVAAHRAEAEAKLKGDGKAVERHRQAANDEKIALQTLLGEASKEFKQVWITPFLEALEESGATLTKNITEASQRIEVTAGGEARHEIQEPEYDTAEDTWANIDANYAKKQQLRAA